MKRTLFLLVILGITLAGCQKDNTSALVAKEEHDLQALVPASEEAQQVSAAPALTKPAQVTVYSSRKEHLIKPLFDQFSEETDIEVRYITDKAGPLIARLKAEGENTPADMLITVDVGNLWLAGEKEGLLRPVESEVLEENIPAYLQASDNSWFGLSKRARSIVYANQRVDPEELSTYENLANEQWLDRLCLRTSKKVYNQSLVATMIANLGEEETEKVVSGWVANLAAEPFSSDTKALQAVAAGQCDVTIVNSYYLGRLLRDEPDLALTMFWPNQEGRGVHINVSGAGVTKHAKNPDGAQQLLEWLSTAKAQQLFAGLNLEYPVNADVELAEEIRNWGNFKADTLNVETAGKLQPEAVKLMDRAQYY